MADVLTFQVRRSASQELPVLTPAVAHALTGSVTGADDVEVQRRAVEANPSRLLTRLRCVRGHTWQAPTRGACPTCHTLIVTVLAALPCMARRV